MSKNNPEQEQKLAGEGWLTVPAAAALAGVTDSTIYRWLDGHELEERRVGGRRYVSRTSVEQQVEKTKTPQP